ncbi:MAG: hypothetical protein WCJ04_09765 [Actinomycetes bacterium]
MRTPESAAIPAPKAHAIIEVRDGRPPLSCNNPRSSTTARIATPRRVRLKTNRNPTATAMAMAIAMRRW